MMNLMMRLWKDEEGQGMAEYGLIIFAVALVVLVGLAAFGGALSEWFSELWDPSLPGG
ncbi:Flp family type IVb pilin [Gudongella sp. SC589]|uniref:Flp family type IVb pilin n=1 Tax=Gudongella sp. SC589 TaxID=3385990 RepID=UPI003904AB06